MQALNRRLQNAGLGSAMADLAMLLLIFFMTTTTIDPPKTIDLDLPQAITSGVENEIFFLSIDKNGAIHFGDELIDEKELKVILLEKESSRGRRVNISADKRVPFEKVDNVLSLLRTQGFLNISFMAEPKK